MSAARKVSDAEAIEAIIRSALAEDVGEGDVTSVATIGRDVTAAGQFLSKEDGVLSGTFAASKVFQTVDETVQVDWLRGDGDEISRGEVIGRVDGNARSVLTAERTALNILQRMSGIATITARMVDEARPFGAKILDTRKTAPGLRILDKMAVAHGGGANHRFGLFDMILIKDNHIAASGSIARALESAEYFRQTYGNPPLAVEIEARTLGEVREVIAFWETHRTPDRILLDNMTKRLSDDDVDTSLLREAVKLVGGRFETEASGNVELSTVAAIARTGVDFISSGALTHSVRALDISLDVSTS